MSLHFQDLLHRSLHLGFGRFRRNLEHQCSFGLFHVQPLFGNDRTANDLISGFHYATSAFRREALSLSEPASFSSAGREKIALSYFSRCYGCTWLLATSSTPALLRALRWRFLFSRVPSISSAVFSTPRLSSDLRYAPVLASFSSKLSTTVRRPSASLAESAARSAPSSFFFGNW